MSVFQILASLFAVFMLYVVNIHRRKLQMARTELFFWYTLWVSFIVFALFPHLLLGIAGTLQFSRVFDFLVVLAMMVLSLIVITSYFLQRENSRKLEEVVRQVAIKRAIKKNQKK